MKTFDTLDLRSKNDLIKQKGSRIITISYEKYCVTLFSLDDQLIERYFNINTCQIEMVKSAKDKDLEKYLGFITINEVFWIL